MEEEKDVKELEEEFKEEEKKEEKPTDTSEPVEPGYKEELEAVRTEYEAKISELQETHKKELKERTDVIKQLLTGGKITDEQIDYSERISERINKNREFTKW